MGAGARRDAAWRGALAALAVDDGADGASGIGAIDSGSSRAALLHMARAYPVGMRRIRWEARKLAMIRTMSATKRELAERADRAARAGGAGGGESTAWRGAPPL
mgnify:CR=1 FL=1